MIHISFSATQQDTVRVRNIVLNDSLGYISDSTAISIKSDTIPIVESIPLKDSVAQKRTPPPRKTEIVITDTTSVCSRNKIADITFYDPDNIVTIIESLPYKKFPFVFIEKSKQIKNEARATLIRNLKPGQDLPYQQFHGDWITVIILMAAFLYSLIMSISKDLFPGITKYFMFRGLNDPTLRDTEGIFNWQSTIHNFISFLIIALFAYFAASYQNIIPSGINGKLFCLYSFGIIVLAVTLRHFTCVLTGGISGEKEVFREYLISVYHSYRFSALIIFMIIIITSYTSLFPVRISIISGIIVLLFMYLMRIIRLLIIFMKRNISLFYLILYLCALEILPVLISVKYFTGLI